MLTELHIACSSAERQLGRLDSHWSGETAHPTLDELKAATVSAPPAHRWLLSGGEPTVRPDLPALIQTLAKYAPKLGMRTDGLLLSRAGIADHLAEAGLSFVRIPLHSGRADAHDWLVRLPGATRKVRQALDMCAKSALGLEAEVVLTRPTAPYLVETTSLLVRHGVSAIRFRFLQRRSEAAEDYISLAPRLGLLQPLLEDAVRQALRHDVSVSIEGVPLCAAPSFPGCQLPNEAVEWLYPQGLGPAAPPAGSTPACPGCPGSPACDGPPPGYPALFGWSELQSEGGLQARSHAVVPQPLPASGSEVPPPPSRAGRAPATRLRAAIKKSELPNFGGDPLAGRHPDPDAEDTIELHFDPQLPTRRLRMRLVRAAQHGAHSLRIAGQSLDHPNAHELLREAQRLSFDRIHVQGTAHPIDAWTDAQIFHLRGLERLDITFFGTDASTHDAHTKSPGSFAASQRVAERVSRLAGIQVGAVAGNEAVEQALIEGHPDLPVRGPQPAPALMWTDESGGTIPRNRR